MAFGRPELDPDTQRRLALEMLPSIRQFAPKSVIYIHKGGEIAGRAIAGKLEVPVRPLDIRYPGTRLIERSPAVLRIILLATKELLYRATSPSLAPIPAEALPSPGSRVLLVDDSASTGRTLRIALKTLAAAGIARNDVRVLVIRCGPRARQLVDHYALGERLFFAPRNEHAGGDPAD